MSKVRAAISKPDPCVTFDARDSKLSLLCPSPSYLYLVVYSLPSLDGAVSQLGCHDKASFRSSSKGNCCLRATLLVQAKQVCNRSRSIITFTKRVLGTPRLSFSGCLKLPRLGVHSLA